MKRHKAEERTMELQNAINNTAEVTCNQYGACWNIVTEQNKRIGCIKKMCNRQRTKIKSLSRSIDSMISMLPKNEVFDSNQKATRFSTATKLVESSQLSNAQSPRASLAVPQSLRSPQLGQQIGDKFRIRIKGNEKIKGKMQSAKEEICIVDNADKEEIRILLANKILEDKIIKMKQEWSDLTHSQRSSLPHSQRSSMVHSSQGSRASERASTQMVQPRKHSMIRKSASTQMVGAEGRSGVDSRSSMLHQKRTGMKNKLSDLKCSMGILREKQGIELSEMKKQMSKFIAVNVSRLFEERQLLMYDNFVEKDLEMDELRKKMTILMSNGEGEKRQARDNKNQFQNELIASDQKVRHLENENQLLRDLLRTKRDKLKCEINHIQREIADIEQAKSCHECDDRYSPRNTMARIRESTERALPC